MKVTKNLVWFSIINLVSSITFFTLLATGVMNARVNNQSNIYVTLVPALYAVIWFVTNMVFIKLDKVRESRYNLNLAYHLASTAVVLVAMLYAVLKFDVFRSFNFVVFPVLVMALSLVIHWLAVRKNPKGIDKKDAFK